jgi:hypothetical protein
VSTARLNIQVFSTPALCSGVTVPALASLDARKYHTMQLLIISLGIPLGIAWLISEFKGGKLLRVILGVLAIVGVAFVVHLATILEPNYVRQFYGASFIQMEGLLSAGDTNTVVNAVRTHNAITRTGTVYQAAQTFMSALEAGNQKSR